VEVASKQECADTEHLDKLFQDILDKGGEGIILRDPNALYEPGRSRGFIKHKVHPSFRRGEFLSSGAYHSYTPTEIQRRRSEDITQGG